MKKPVVDSSKKIGIDIFSTALFLDEVIQFVVEPSSGLSNEDKS